MKGRIFSKARRAERRRRYSYAQLATAPWRALPDFLVVGAMKAGTTSLFHYLRQHPQVMPSRKKEVKYFDLHSRYPTLWYRAHFPLRRELARAGAITGEASPHYLLPPDVPGRIRALLGTPRLVVMLRDPVTRAISHYADLCRRRGETRPIERLYRRVPENDEGYVLTAADPAGWSLSRHGRDLVARGIYDVQLRRYFETFGRENVHVAFLEELSRDPQGEMAAIFAFLGLPPVPVDTGRTHNKGHDPEIDPGARAWLERRFVEPNRRLAALLQRDLPW